MFCFPLCPLIRIRCIHKCAEREFSIKKRITPSDGIIRILLLCCPESPHAVENSLCRCSGPGRNARKEKTVSADIRRPGHPQDGDSLMYLSAK